MLANIYNAIRHFGQLPSLAKDYQLLNKQLENRSDFKITKFFLIAGDKHAESGIMSGHYFHQDLWAAQKIFAHKPLKHVDIGSRIDGFVAHVASYREIEIIDIRPIESKIENIIFKQADLMLDIQKDNPLAEYTDSISSLSVLEHFGLGRYGDSIDIDGHIKGFMNILNMLKSGGKFYFSVPIGPQRIEFNAHRVFSLRYLVDLISPYYSIQTFSYIDDKGDLQKDIELNNALIENNANCVFGCGLFELIKK